MPVRGPPDFRAATADRFFCQKFPDQDLFLLRFGCARTGSFAADLPLRLVRPRDRPRSQRRQESRRVGRKLCGDCLWRNALWRARHPSAGWTRSRETGSVEAGTGQQRPGLWSGTARSALRRSRQVCIGSGERCPKSSVNHCGRVWRLRPVGGGGLSAWSGAARCRVPADPGFGRPDPIRLPLACLVMSADNVKANGWGIGRGSRPMPVTPPGKGHPVRMTGCGRSTSVESGVG